MSRGSCSRARLRGRSKRRYGPPWWSISNVLQKRPSIDDLVSLSSPSVEPLRERIRVALEGKPPKHALWRGEPLWLPRVVDDLEQE